MRSRSRPTSRGCRSPGGASRSAPVPGARVGQVFLVDGRQHAVALAGGLAPVTPFQAALVLGDPATVERIGQTAPDAAEPRASTPPAEDRAFRVPGTACRSRCRGRSRSARARGPPCARVPRWSSVARRRAVRRSRGRRRAWRTRCACHRDAECSPLPPGGVTLPGDRSGGSAPLPSADVLPMLGYADAVPGAGGGGDPRVAAHRSRPLSTGRAGCCGQLVRSYPQNRIGSGGRGTGTTSVSCQQPAIRRLQRDPGEAHHVRIANQCGVDGNNRTPVRERERVARRHAPAPDERARRAAYPVDRCGWPVVRAGQAGVGGRSGEAEPRPRRNGHRHAHRRAGSTPPPTRRPPTGSPPTTACRCDRCNAKGRHPR